MDVFGGSIFSPYRTRLSRNARWRTANASMIMKAEKAMATPEQRPKSIVPVAMFPLQLS